VDGDEAGLAEFRVPDGQNPALEIDILPVERQRFARPQPGGGEQANERGIRVGP
jgi:hypothetical protein